MTGIVKTKPCLCCAAIDDLPDHEGVRQDRRTGEVV